MTPLMDAAERGDMDMAHLLLDAGADPRRVMRDGHTALSLAERLLAFCDDLDAGGADLTAELAAQLAITGRVCLWWD